MSLPLCDFSAPTGKEFDAWEVESVRYNLYADLTITADTTVKALWKSLRTEIATIEATSDIPQIVSTAGTVKPPAITVTTGSPAIFDTGDPTNAGWYRMNGSGDVEKYTKPAFEPGVYRYMCPIRIKSGAGADTHKLSASLAVTVDSQHWTVDHFIITPQDSECIAFSQEITMFDPGNDPGTNPRTDPSTNSGTTTTVQKYTITVDGNGGKWSDGSTTILLYGEKDSYVKLPKAPVKNGYTFLYSKGSEYQPGDYYLVQGDHAFTAEWKANPATSDPSSAHPVTPHHTLAEAGSTTNKENVAPKTGNNAILLVSALALLSIACGMRLVWKIENEQ